MTQEEFVKKFCPDYEKRIKIVSSDMVQSIEDEMFNDALQAFVRRLCEAQKEICASDAKCKYNNDIFQSSTTSVSSLVDSILNSPTPNLSNL